VSAKRLVVQQTAAEKPQGSSVLPIAKPIEAAWQESSFDLAQALDVKVMQSKLSREILDCLFRS
jgi:hypothetical protein